MPCTKCENGKYKWGKTGECKYDSKEACEKANKKNYNKMRPTPLGKTYEQYEKELKEFHLSSQRFDFKNMKTLKSLEEQLEKIMSNISDAEADVKKSVNNYEEKNLANKEAIEKLDLSEKNYRTQEKKIEEVKKEMVKIEKEYDKLDKAQDKTAAQKEKFAQAVFKQTDKYESNYKKGEDIVDKLKSAIKEVEKAAKALDVDIPLSKFEQALTKFNNTSSEPLREINFDY